MIVKLVVLGIFLSSSTIQCKNLPKYVTKCSIKDADQFSRCVLNNAKNVLPKIVNGDRNHKIPNLNPFFIGVLEVSSGASLNLTLFNVTLQGLPTVDFKSVNYNKETRQFVFDLGFDQLRFDGHYKVNGKILVLPVVGSGTGFIDFRKPHLLFSYNLMTYKGKNGEVIRIGNPNLVSDFEKAVIHLDNLFNGEKVLGDGVNKFLNENWEAVITEFQEIIKTTFSSIFSNILGAFLNDLTYDAAFDGV